MTYYIRERKGSEVCDIYTDTLPPAFDHVTSTDTREDAEEWVAAGNARLERSKAKERES